MSVGLISKLDNADFKFGQVKGDGKIELFLVDSISQNEDVVKSGLVMDIKDPNLKTRNFNNR